MHRVNHRPFDGKRVFVRINFSPVAIEDPTNTSTPSLPRVFGKRVDVRNFLSPYRTDERIDSGFGWLSKSS